jgi:type II secretory pathway pseudopilin PulG
MLNKSFTLIETLVAISILTTGILAISSLISYLISVSSISKQRLVAAYLAQEGIEIVRNLRDTNLISLRNWDYGLDNGEWQADYDDLSLSSYSGTFLNLETSGFYGYGSGTPTNFRRVIRLQKSGDVLNINVEVSWFERGRWYSLTVQEKVYNWQI